MGRLKRGYFIALLLLFASPAVAEMPAQLDSLKQYVEFATRLESVVPAAAMTWAVNAAIQQVCDDFDALPKIDTVLLRQDSVGTVINSDFLRLRWVMKRHGDTMWVPMGEIRADTIFLRVIDTSDAKLKPDDPIQPQFYMWHNKLFTHPKYSGKDTTAQFFIVAYWATDDWIRGAETATLVRAEYRNAIIDYASYLVSRRRGNFSDAAVFKQDYKERLGR